MSSPKVEKDSQGRWVITGVQNQKITQQQVDYNELVKASELLPPGTSARAQSVLRTNPIASGGVLAGLVQNGALPNNDLAKTLVDIDQLTKDKRALDSNQERLKAETERFKNTTRGQLWRVLKAAVRTLTFPAVTIVEGFNAGTRSVVNVGEDIWRIPKIVEGIRKGDLDLFFGESKVPGKTSEELGYGKTTGFRIPFEELTVYQAAKELFQTGRVNFGEGFFPSEEAGAGFAARQAALKSKGLVIEMGDRTYTRPYNVTDPLTNLITGGNADTQGGTLISALGEVLLFWKADPILLASRKIKKIRDLDRQIKTSAGKVEAKKITQLANTEAQLDELIKTRQNLFEAYKISPIAKEDEVLAAYQKALDEEFKVAQQFDELSDVGYNVDTLAAFLSSEKGSVVLDTLAEMDQLSIFRLGKGGPRTSGFTWEQSKALGKATTRDEVARAIAPYINEGTVVANVLETGTRTGRFLSRLVPGSDNLVPNVIKSNAGRVIRQMPYVNKVAEVLAKPYNAVVTKPVDYVRRAYNTVVPSNSLVHFADSDLLAKQIISYGRITNVSDDAIDKILTAYAASDDPQGGAFKAATQLMKEITRANAGRVDEKLLKDITRIFENGKSEMSSYWAARHASGARLEYMFANGKKVYLDGPHLESELLNSMMYFPDAKELIKTISMYQKLAPIRGLTQAGDFLIGNIWKKFVLVRPAYAIRNIMEEQIRVFGTGHISFFNRPGTAIAMWLGREQSSNPVRRLLAHFDPYKNTIGGQNLKLGSAADEFGGEVIAHEMAEDYLKFIQNSFSTSMERDSVKISQIARSSEVEVGHPKFFDAIANEIRMLRNTIAARAVIINEKNPQGAVSYLLRGEGKKEWLKFANSKPEDVKNFLLSDEGLMMFLYTGKDEAGRLVSLASRIEEVAGNGGPASVGIKALIANGEFKSIAGDLKVPTAVDSAQNSIKNAKEVAKGRKAIQDSNEEFAGSLKQYFDGQGDWKGLRFKVPEQLTLTEMRGPANWIDSFFDVVVKFEKQTTMGPEWRQTYWDAIYDIARGLDEEAVAKLAEVAEKSLSPLVSWAGRPIGREHKVWQAFKSTKPGGNITRDEAHAYAANVANQKTANLFYDASKKRLLYHQLRLVLPFGQAWDDTIQAWGRIALDNPDQVYKVIKTMDWLTSPESSALYQLTDARDVYDPNDGFFFSDKRTGERKLFVPLLGSALNMLSNVATGKGLSTEGPYVYASTPQSFNFAFASGSIMPGVGPGISFSISVLDSLMGDPMNILPKGLREPLDKIIFPFGRPSTQEGVIETFLLSGNWRRILSAPFVEASYSGSFGPIMNYMMNSGDYDLNDTEDQAQLVRDTTKFAKWFTFFRGVVGLAAAAPLIPEAVSKDEDGDTTLSVALYNDFKELEVNSGGNYNKAYADFLDLYGPQYIFAIIGTTTGAPTNLLTYEKIVDDPSIINKYNDTYGFFYPGGGFSQELYRWQQRRGVKKRLNAQDIVDKATSIRFYAARDRLLTRAMAENWPAERLELANKDLTETYAMRGLTQKADVYKNKRVMLQLKEAVNDDRFVDSDAVNGLRRYLYFRDTALTAAGKKLDGTLKSKGTIEQRKWLAEKAKEIIQDNPEFYKMFYSFFRNELDVK